MLVYAFFFSILDRSIIAFYLQLTSWHMSRLDGPFHCVNIIRRLLNSADGLSNFKQEIGIQPCSFDQQKHCDSLLYTRAYIWIRVRSSTMTWGE